MRKSVQYPLFCCGFVVLAFALMLGVFGYLSVLNVLLHFYMEFRLNFVDEPVQHPRDFRSLELRRFANLVRYEFPESELALPPNIEEFRIMAGAYAGQFWLRFPFGAMSSCPRTPAKIGTEMFVGATNVRVLSVDWAGSAGSDESEHVVIYFHGGGFVSYSPELSFEFLGRLSRRLHARIIAVDYSLGPENPLPAAFKDGMAVYEWVLRDVVNHDGSRISLGGDSSGGGIVVRLLQELSVRSLCADLKVCIGSSFVVSPWLDYTMEIAENGSIAEFDRDATDDFDIMISREELDFMRRYAVGNGTDREGYRALSPLHGQFENFPPLLVMVSRTEALRDESISLVEKVNHAGGLAELYMPDHDYPHVWVVSCLPEGVEDTAILAHWLLQHWKDSVS